MTSVVAPVEQPRRLLRQPLGFVWTAWRALTRRHFYYAALAGLGFALVEGTGVAMWARESGGRSFSAFSRQA